MKHTEFVTLSLNSLDRLINNCQDIKKISHFSHELLIQIIFSLPGYIAWHGRYSAYDYASFAAFMRHTFSEVQGVGCPVFQCDSCKNDMTIDDESLGKFIHVK